MKLKWIAAISLLALAGCQSSRLSSPPPQPPAPPPVVQPGEPLVWGRQDCKRASTNPEIQDHFSRTKAYCEQASGLASGDTANAPMVSCMRQRGYNYGTRADHDATCAARQTTAQRR